MRNFLYLSVFLHWFIRCLNKYRKQFLEFGVILDCGLFVQQSFALFLYLGLDKYAIWFIILIKRFNQRAHFLSLLDKVSIKTIQTLEKLIKFLEFEQDLTALGVWMYLTLRKTRVNMWLAYRKGTHVDNW